MSSAQAILQTLWDEWMRAPAVDQDRFVSLFGEMQEQIQAALSDHPRVAVEDFAHAMETELRANDHKPGWLNDTPTALLERLRQEVLELQNAVDAGEDRSEILKEAADVANFAMMIADVYGR